jgi:hypothetical protein
VTRKEILIQLDKQKIFHYNPPWSDETGAALVQLEKEDLIESCYKQHPTFMNSSYAYVYKGAKVIVKSKNSFYWLEVLNESPSQTQA